MADNDRASGTKAAVPPVIPYPDYLRVEKPPYRPRVMRVPVDVYFKPEVHEQEVERIWKKCWQWACRLEDIPEVGDYQVYEVAELSFIVIRTATDEIKAYWNACLHRGRKLCPFHGKRATELRCMYHGWAWGIDGRLADMNGGWDFAGLRDEEFKRLPEAKVGIWGGFVFINPDPDCEPLEEFLGELPDHFEGAGNDLADRWKQVHVVAEVPANWKVVQEAFIEAWHVTYTHPQLTRTGTDERVTMGNRWDDFGNWMRSAPALPTDKEKSPPSWITPAETEQQAINSHFNFHLNEEPLIKLEEGQSARQLIFERAREYYRELIGDEIDEHHDAHLLGGQMVSVFPNLHPWGGFSRLCYRFRPSGSDPERSLMDVLLLSPWPRNEPKPPPATPHVLGPDEPITNAPELGYLARIFLQDLGNLPAVQAGLKNMPRGYVVFGQHNEAAARHFHDLYNRWMELPDEAGEEGGRAS